jgi:hypothetical protein
MTPDDAVDVGGAGVERLMPLLPDATRAARTRERCHAQLRKRRQRAVSRSQMAAYAWGVVGPAVVGGVCVLYASALFATAVRLTFR